MHIQDVYVCAHIQTNYQNSHVWNLQLGKILHHRTKCFQQKHLKWPNVQKAGMHYSWRNEIFCRFSAPVLLMFSTATSSSWRALVMWSFSRFPDNSPQVNGEPGRNWYCWCALQPSHQQSFCWWEACRRNSMEKWCAFYSALCNCSVWVTHILPHSHTPLIPPPCSSSHLIVFREREKGKEWRTEERKKGEKEGLGREEEGRRERRRKEGRREAGWEGWSRKGREEQKVRRGRWRSLLKSTFGTFLKNLACIYTTIQSDRKWNESLLR